MVVEGGGLKVVVEGGGLKVVVDRHCYCCYS